MKANSADESAGFGPSTPFQNTSSSDSTFVGLDEDRLLLKYSPALRDWAWRYCGGNGELWNDLFQKGALGLFQAARRFDPAQGVKFSTLARRHMRGRMLNYSRSECCHRRCMAMAHGRYACAWDFTGASDGGVSGSHGEDTRRICEIVI